MKQVQNSSSISPTQAAAMTPVSGLRCTDFNYNKMTKNYYGESDKQGTSNPYRRQPVGIQERKQAPYYGVSKDPQQQYTDLQYKRNGVNAQNTRNNGLTKEESNKYEQEDVSPLPRSNNTDSNKYQTPQKPQTTYHTRSYTTSFSDQWGQKDEIKSQDHNPLADNKEQLKQKYLRYTAEHSRYQVSVTDDGANCVSNGNSNHKDNTSVDYNQRSTARQDQRKLQDSPTKENEFVSYSDKQQQQSNLKSYSGFISRGTNNYYKRQPTFESPIREEKQSVRESYSKILNYKTSSAFTRDSSPQSVSNKSYRATQSDQKNFTEEIEQYKKELQEYQSQLTSYQEQLRNTLNKNRIELFEGLASKRDDFLTSSVSSYSKTSFLDMKPSSHLTRQSLDPSSVHKMTAEKEVKQSTSQMTRLTESVILNNSTSQHHRRTEVDLFASINIDSTSFDASPQKVLEVINLDNSTTLHPPNIIQCESEIVPKSSQSKQNSLIRLRKVDNEQDFVFKTAQSEYEQQQKVSVSAFSIEDKSITNYGSVIVENPNLNIKAARSISTTIPSQEGNTLKQVVSEIISSNHTHENRYRSISSNVIRMPVTLTSSVYESISENEEILGTRDCMSSNSKQNCDNEKFDTKKIDSVSNQDNDKQHNTLIQPKPLNSNLEIKEQQQSSAPLPAPITVPSDLQANKKLETSENIINNKYDKLKEIELRYKRVEEISKKYSHLYKSKLLQTDASSLFSKPSSIEKQSAPTQNPQQLTNIKKDSGSLGSLSNSSSSSLEKSDNITQLSTQTSIPSEAISKLDNKLIKALPQMNKENNNKPEKKEINFFMQQTPRFSTTEGEEYFKTAEQILILSRQNAKQLNSSFLQETLQNLSQYEIDCDMNDDEVNHTFRFQNEKSPSVTSL